MAEESTGMCIVPNCLSVYYAGCHTRFLKFPKTDKKRNKWLRSLKLSPKDYHERARICYLHFHFTDYAQNNPKKALKKNAVPSISVNKCYPNTDDSDSESFDLEKELKKINEESSYNESDDLAEEKSSESSDNMSKKDKVKPKRKPKRVMAKPKVVKKNGRNGMLSKVKKKEREFEKEKYSENFGVGVIDDVLAKVCRTCLATGCKMYPMKQYELEQTYILLTGVSSDMYEESKMPQVMCFECVRKLQNFVEFSTKSLTAWSFLMELIEKDNLTISSIESIDRQKHLLTSKLSISICEPNYFDIKVEEYENDIAKEGEKDENIPELIESIKIDNEEYCELTEDLGIANEVKHELSDESDINEDCPSETKDCKTERTNRIYKDLFIVKYMTPEEQRAEIDKRKYSNRYKNSGFKCDKCYTGFQIKERFIDHMKRHTNECGEFICDICQTHFRTRHAIYKHITCSHEKYMQCRLCPFASPYCSAASSHKNHHDGYRFQCDKCPKHYAKHSTYMYHVERMHPEDAVCHLCGESNPSARELEKHLRTAHKREDLQLQPSTSKPKCFGEVRKMENTSKFTALCFASMLPEDSPSCSTCDIRFRDNKALQAHLSQSPTHGNPPKKVQKKVVKRFVYNSQKYIHKPVTCEQCGEVLSTFRKYLRHFHLQHPDHTRVQYAHQRAYRNSMCELCGKIFYSAAVLEDHRRTHTGDKPYQCDACGKSFASKSTLRIHWWNHMQSRECKVCGKQFATVSGLQTHVLIHTHKPYACEPCNKRFPTPAARRVHVRHVHMGVPWPKKRPKGAPKLRRRGGEVWFILSTPLVGITTPLWITTICGCPILEPSKRS